MADSANQEKWPAILFFGPPGVGKGTQAKFLNQVTPHYHLSSGDIFRGIPPASPAGKMQASYSNQGLLVPDEITIKICCQYIQGLIDTYRFDPSQNLLLLDGVPRTEPQAKMMEPHLDIKGIISLEVQDEEKLIQRLKKRAEIEGRADDADENILKTRLSVYKEQTKATLSNYPESLIIRINGDQKPLEVLTEILSSCKHLI